MLPFTKSKVQLTGNLFKLPTELRVMIYEELFPSRTIAVEAINGGFYTKKPFGARTVNHTAALLATCQALYDEAGSVLYNETDFRVSVRDQEYHRHVQQYVDLVAAPVVRDHYRDFTTLRRVRKLSLYVALRIWFWGVSKGKYWPGQVIAQISCASEIKELRMMFDFELHANLRPGSNMDTSGQKSFDDVISLFDHLWCSGTVRAYMGLSIGERRLDTEPYYLMLANIGGLDQTRHLYADQFKQKSELYQSKIEELAATNIKLMEKQQQQNDLRECHRRQSENFTKTKLNYVGKYVELLISRVFALENEIDSAKSKMASLEDELENQIGNRWSHLEA